MTHKRLAIIGAALLAAACASNSEPEPAGDPAKGQLIAQDLCASCHAIGATGASTMPDAPPLRDVLARRGATRLTADLESARHIAFLRMPQFFFGDGSAQNLVAYIETIQPPAAN